jgi:hypothetical protein
MPDAAPALTGPGLLERLASAEGADVYDSGGRRLGTFIEVVADGGEVAIRRDGAFVWRRRTLPVSAVADVLPNRGARGAVFLNVDRARLNDATALSGVTEYDGADHERRNSEEELGARLAPYVRARRNDEHAPSERHLLFVSSPEGYRLVERDGPPPAALEYVSLPGYENVFRVIKLAESPLPGDRRMCAYLGQS